MLNGGRCDTKRNTRPTARRPGRPCWGLLLAVGLCACGGTELDGVGGVPLVTLEACHELGGTPLFDPGDGRPLESSCPEGLGLLGVFDEPFFGSDGGLCCGSPDAVAPVDAFEREL